MKKKGKKALGMRFSVANNNSTTFFWDWKMCASLHLPKSPGGIFISLGRS